MRGDHHHRVDVHAGLRVVALLEAAARHRHDARLFVCQVDLVAVLGAGLGRPGILAARLLAGLTLGLALGLLGIELLLLGLEAFGCALLDLGLGLRDRAQAIFTARDLRRHVHAVRYSCAVALLGQGQQGLHLLAQLRFDLVGVRPGQRLVLARVGADLGAVERDVAELEQLHLAREHQHLHEQRLDFLQEAPPERGQRVVVGVRVGRHVAERHRVVGRAFDLAARMHAVGITVDQQPQQNSRVVRGRAATRVLLDEVIEIETVDHFDNEASQMIAWQPFVHRGRQEVGSVSVNGNEAAHCEAVMNALPQLSRTTSSFASLESPTAS